MSMDRMKSPDVRDSTAKNEARSSKSARRRKFPFHRCCLHLLLPFAVVGVVGFWFCRVHVVSALSRPSPTLPPTTMTNKLLILGLGRVGQQVSDLAVASQEFQQVVGTVRQTKPSLDGTVGSRINDITMPVQRQISFDLQTVSDELLGTRGTTTIHAAEVDANGTLSAAAAVAATTTTHVLFTIPLSTTSDPVLESILRVVQQWYLSSAPSSLSSTEQSSKKWLGLLSTTGVYGNYNGKWVTEDSPLLCQEDSNAHFYQTLEKEWIQMALQQQQQQQEENPPALSSPSRRLCIFRCAGIYDSKRSALHTVYNQREYRPSSTRIIETASLPAYGKTNRIHSVDLARAVLQSMMVQEASMKAVVEDEEIKNESYPFSKPYRVYNLADNLPEIRSVVLDYAYSLLSSIGAASAGDDDDDGKDDTKSTVATDSASNNLPSHSSAHRQSRRQREQKLVSNLRMKRELLPSKDNEEGGDLLYPTYREGLNAIFLDPSTPWRQDMEKK